MTRKVNKKYFNPYYIFKLKKDIFLEKNKNIFYSIMEYDFNERFLKLYILPYFRFKFKKIDKYNYKVGSYRERKNYFRDVIYNVDYNVFFTKGRNKLVSKNFINNDILYL
jgi:hypothetical protein